jgi:hypothetical protein
VWVDLRARLNDVEHLPFLFSFHLPSVIFAAHVYRPLILERDAELTLNINGGEFGTRLRIEDHTY